MLTNLKSILAVMAIFSLLATAPAQAATLSSFGPTIASGTAPYVGNTLSGTIEYAVFTEAVFEANFAGFDVPAGELAYVYQILNGALDPVSSNTVIGINSSVSGIGDFTIDALEPEVSPQGSTLIPSTSASWDFSGAGNNVPSNGLSSGLVLTSPNLPGPVSTVNIVVDGGGSAIAYVIAPGDTPVPEPTTLALSVVAVYFGLAVRRRAA